jgi:hypothetical protein
MSTFKVHDVEPIPFKPEEDLPEDPVATMFEADHPGTEARGTNLEEGWLPGSATDYYYDTKRSPFLAAAKEAYNRHWGLTISPDDVWLMIAHGLALHIGENAEKLREQFVSHEGKKALMVRRDGFVKGSPDNDWEGCFTEFSDQLAEYIGKKRDLIVCDFSTTGPIERAASEVVLMDAMQSYFAYACMTMSGFRDITLTGTVEDWKKVRDKAYAISEFGLTWWTDHLIPTLDQFVAAAEGNPDIEFWKRMINYSGGSGASTISGWAVTFSPYLIIKDGFKRSPFLEWEAQAGRRGGPEDRDVPKLMSKVPFTWYYHGQSIKMEFLGGIVSSGLNVETQNARSVTAWAVRQLDE